MKPTRRDDICTGLIIALLILHAARGGALPLVNSDPVQAVLAHETASDDATMRDLLIGLRNGSAAEYFKEGGRRLLIVDDDGTDETGKQVIPAADLQGVTLPAILCYSKSHALVGKETIPKGATPESVIAQTRRYGG